MASKKKNDKGYFQIRNYIYYFIVILIIVLACWYVYSWYKVINEEKLKSSYLLSTNTVSLTFQDINEVKKVMQETPNDYIVFISYRNDLETYQLEKRLKNLIDNNDLADHFYYLDVTDIIEDDDLIKKLNDTFGTKEIKSVPTILVYTNDKLVDILENNDRIVTDLKEIITNQTIEN